MIPVYFRSWCNGLKCLEMVTGVTFNHGVPGSTPGGLTNKNKGFSLIFGAAIFPKWPLGKHASPARAVSRRPIAVYGAERAIQHEASEFRLSRRQSCGQRTRLAQRVKLVVPAVELGPQSGQFRDMETTRILGLPSGQQQSRRSGVKTGNLAQQQN